MRRVYARCEALHATATPSTWPLPLHSYRTPTRLHDVQLCAPPPPSPLAVLSAPLSPPPTPCRAPDSSESHPYPLLACPLSPFSPDASKPQTRRLSHRSPPHPFQIPPSGVCFSQAGELACAHAPCCAPCASLRGAMGWAWWRLDAPGQDHSLASARRPGSPGKNRHLCWMTPDQRWETTLMVQARAEVMAGGLG